MKFEMNKAPAMKKLYRSRHSEIYGTKWNKGSESVDHFAGCFLMGSSCKRRADSEQAFSLRSMSSQNDGFLTGFCLLSLQLA